MERHFLTLPAEIRLDILEYVFPIPSIHNYLIPGEHIHKEQLQSGIAKLAILSTCQQFRSDFTPLAFSRTVFVLGDYEGKSREPKIPFSTRIALLRTCQIKSIRYILVPTEYPIYHDISDWHHYPFNIPDLNISEFTVVRVGAPLLESEGTQTIAQTLMQLRNVRTLRFVFCVLGGDRHRHFLSSYFRLICHLLQEDYRQRYEASDAPKTEETWWKWERRHRNKFFEFSAQPPRPAMDEEGYKVMMQQFQHILYMFWGRVQKIEAGSRDRL